MVKAYTENYGKNGLYPTIFVKEPRHSEKTKK